MFDPIKKDADAELFWGLAERWFRLLEMGLILGTVGFLNAKTDNWAITAIYWLSWLVLYMWFLEFGESIAVSFTTDKSIKRRWVVWVLSMIFTTLFYIATSYTTTWIIEQQFGG